MAATTGFHPRDRGALTLFRHMAQPSAPACATLGPQLRKLRNTQARRAEHSADAAEEADANSTKLNKHLTHLAALITRETGGLKHLKRRKHRMNESRFKSQRTKIAHKKGQNNDDISKKINEI